MGAAGLWMLLATAAVMALAGLPAWLVLISISMLFTLGGLAFGVFGLPLLFALPARVLGLLEHDLLQALPLYVFIGALLNRLPLAEGRIFQPADGTRRNRMSSCSNASDTS